MTFYLRIPWDWYILTCLPTFLSLIWYAKSIGKYTIVTWILYGLWWSFLQHGESHHLWKLSIYTLPKLNRLPVQKWNRIVFQVATIFKGRAVKLRGCKAIIFLAQTSGAKIKDFIMGNLRVIPQCQPPPGHKALLIFIKGLWKPLVCLNKAG